MKKKVLVVDDDEPIRMFLDKMLGKSYEVITKSDGLMAMRWLSKGNMPDLILSDMRMPSISGVDFLKNLKKSGIYRDIPVIVLSGWDDEDEKKECLSMGAAAYLEKPFNPDQLTELINKVLNVNQEIRS